MTQMKMKKWHVVAIVVLLFLLSGIVIILRNNNFYKEVNLCNVDMNEVDAVYKNVSHGFFVKRSLVGVEFSTEDISREYLLYDGVGRFRWRKKCSAIYPVYCDVKLVFVDRSNIELIPENPPFAQRIVNFYKDLQDLLESWNPKTDIPDYMDILVNCGDGPMQNPSDQVVPPIFSPCTNSSFIDIPFISAGIWGHFKKQEAVLKEVLLLRPRTKVFGDRYSDSCELMTAMTEEDLIRLRKVAFWRGSTTGAVFTPRNYHYQTRFKLAEISKSDNGSTIDARITGCSQCDPNELMISILKWELGSFYGHKLSNTAALTNYQALVDVDGNAWSTRLPSLLAQGVPVLKQDSEYKEFWRDLLKDGVTHVAVKKDLSDLLEKARELLDNPRRCVEIGANSMLFARKFLIKEAVFRFFVHVMKEYSSLLLRPSSFITPDTKGEVITT